MPVFGLKLFVCPGHSIIRDGNSGLVTDFRGHNLVCMFFFGYLYFHRIKYYSKQGSKLYFKIIMTPLTLVTIYVDTPQVSTLSQDGRRGQRQETE